MAVFVTACVHHVGGACMNALALPLYGASPSAGVCRVCAHYDGLTRKYPNANFPNVVNLTSTVAGTTQAVAI